MPVRRGLSDGGGVKVRRKVGVVAGKSNGSRDGNGTLGPKGDDVDKCRRKAILATGGSKRLSGYVKAAEGTKKGGKKVQGRGNDSFAVSFGDVNENLSGKKSSARKDLKAKNGNARFQAVSDGKLKRTKKNISGNGALNTSEKERDPLPGKKGLSQNKYAVGSVGKIHKTQNGLLKTSGKERDPLPRKKGLSQDKYAVGSVEQARKKIIQRKRGLATDSDLREDPPKKKKRVIRIDPHDTSNKRLDDNTSNNGISHVKKDLEDNADVEMSKNAQFRAIRPSASILSFVEDNLLGRRRDIDFRRAGYNIELSAPLDNIPFSTGSERERIEVPVFRNKLEFFAAAKVSSSFPPPELPEIAFAGRSNVGKSSLLNSLTRQWGVVRTSDKPGLTQTINFFKLGPKLSLVDLPGYGFAFAKDEVKEAWEELVKEYVSTRVGLKRVCLLVDTKWGMKPRDHELVDLMERSETKYQIVLTKTDTVFPIDVARRAMQIEENLKAKKSAVQPLMMVSSKTGAGIRSLRTVLANVARLARR